MSALTTNTTIVKAAGASDPCFLDAGPTALSRTVDFGRLPASAESTNYELLHIPAGSYLVGLHVKEVSKCASSVALTFKLKSDSTVVGPADGVPVGGDSPADSYDQAGAKWLPAGDTLCLCSGYPAGGVVRVAALILRPDGSALDPPSGSEAYR